MTLRMCICPSQPATSMHAKRHGKGFFFCFCLEGFRTSDDHRQLSAITALSDSIGVLFQPSLFPAHDFPLQSIVWSEPLGTNAAKYNAKPSYVTSEHARRTNYLAFLHLPPGQEVGSSNLPGRATSFWSNYLCGCTVSSQNFFAGCVPIDISPSSVHSPRSLIRNTVSVLISPRAEPQLIPLPLPTVSLWVSRKRPWLNARRCYVLLSSSSDDYSKCL